MVDIVMATYNSERFLREQLDSILAQSESNWRLFVSDDGSEDNTREILNEYVRNYPMKIYEVSPIVPYHNVNQNFENALKFTTAPYIMFADHDDVWYRDKMEKTLTHMKSHEDRQQRPCLVHTDVEVVDDTLRTMAQSLWRYAHLTPTQRLSELLFQNVVTGCTMMINRALLSQSVPFPREIFMYDWWTAWVAAQFGSIAPLDVPTLKYRQHGRNVVGAQTLSLPRVRKISTLFETWAFLQAAMTRRLDRTQRQTRAFLTRYTSELDHETIKMLNEYLSLRTLPFAQRRYVALKNHFFMNTWQTTCAMWLLL